MAFDETNSAPEEELRLRVLLVDDDRDDSTIFKKLISHLRDFRIEFTWTSSYDSAINLIRSARFDVHFIDYRLGRESGLDLIEKAMNDDPCRAFVVVSGQGDEKLAAESFRKGAVDYLPKNGLNRDELDRCLRYSVSEAHERARRLRALQQELFDGLTGIYNRDAFLEEARIELAARKGKGAFRVLMRIDIDGMRRINEEYGRAVGDEIIRNVAREVRTELKQGDVFGRFDDDEFALLTSCASLNDAREFADRIRETVAGECEVTVSIGIASERAKTAYLDGLTVMAGVALSGAAERRNTTKLYQRT